MGNPIYIFLAYFLLPNNQNDPEMSAVDICDKKTLKIAPHTQNRKAPCSHPAMRSGGLKN